MRRAVVGACLAFAVLAGPAVAQRDGSRPQPVLIHERQESDGRLALTPLTSDQTARLNEAMRLRAEGKLDQARNVLAPLITEAPHHPIVLAERAAIHLANKEFAQLERLGRAERLAQKDSTVLVRESVFALERLGRAREAAQVMMDAWAAQPRASRWGGATLIQLLALDSDGIRDVVRRTASRLPDRVDIAQALARVEWRLGDLRASLRAVAEHDAPGVRPPLRWMLADEMIHSGNARDSVAGAETLLHFAADKRQDGATRMASARRAWELFERGADPTASARVADALADLRETDWPSDLLIAVSRDLQERGKSAQARALLGAQPAGGQAEPKIALERALADLREGPAEKALPTLREVAGTSPEAAFHYAEGLFFAGQTDSALAWYKLASENPQSPFAGAALERAFLIEDARPPESAILFGELAYQRWRGATRAALTLADSMVRTIERGPTWAQAVMFLSELREASGTLEAALAPVLELVQALPDDRLAPRARQRAGDLYLALGDEAKAAEQYEECLARFPRAWNAPEVRRKLDAMRRDRRF